MRELTVKEVRVSSAEEPPLVLLAEVDGPHLLPIWMSAGGAAAIVGATEEPDPERPCLHDLVGSLLRAMGTALREVRITGYHDGQFFAELAVGEDLIAARPSDALALALRVGCPIRCAAAVMEAAAVLPERSDGAQSGDGDEVERFREFLDSVNPDDF